MRFSDWLTAPLEEKILLRSLLVASQRRRRCPTRLLHLLDTVAVASTHLWIYGVAWGVAMFCLGAMLLAIRLWRDAPTTCRLIHMLFKARGLVLRPLFA